MQKSKQAVILLCLLLLIGSLQTAAPAQASNGTVEITGTSLNVRQGPGLSYPVVGKANKGEKYIIIKQQGDWIQISLPGGRKGWVAEWFTKKESAAAAAPSAGASGTGIVAADSLRVRSGPGTSYASIGSLRNGQSVTVLNTNGSWAKIRHGSLEGWISKDYLNMNGSRQQSVPASGNDAIASADNLNVRVSPALNARVIGKLAKGTKVKVQSQENGWAKIVYQGQAAYVSGQYLSFTSSTPQAGSAASRPAGEATVTASSLYVRDSGSLNGKVVGQVSRGEKFRILEEKDNWLKIEYKPGRTGWAAGWFFEKKASSPAPSANSVKNQSVTVLHNGTNIRKGAGVNTSVVQRANQGDMFKVVSLNGDWYQISLANGGTGYIAGWLVSLNGNQAVQIKKPGAGIHMKNKTVVIDPGHGGRDGGTVGARGTLEKNLNLATARLLYDKLKAAGTNVVMTRNGDSYLSLGSRVSASHYHNADAFISLHYDSIADRSVRGMTTYYYHSSHRTLSKEVHSSVSSRTSLRDRGVRQGDYHVIRENQRPATLLELGYLSNPAEEMLVSTPQYQEAVAAGIFEGLAKYFKGNGQ
ncbi:SH3 domain-containing protein [Bacillus sp. FJAT-27251]|uniref:SH3 domain-containing protein n=1 Tax=Bacillus sp. FJAT-27251 TaxID=1684142 RepID=UPI0006A75C78|nr:SH3 domain-containing protein [Bacillus sp. FJAT-27251]